METFERPSDPWAALKTLLDAFPGRRLPSVRSLAAAWGRSPSSIQQLYREARERGWIETRPGSGTWPAGALPTRQAAPPRRDARNVAEHVAEEIARGRWLSDEPLPSPKVLAQQNGIHPTTMRKALALLSERRLVVRKGRTWTVRQPRLRRSRLLKSVVLCLGAADPEGGLRMGTDREWDFWREIQAEAARCDLRPVILPWNGDLGTEREHSLGAIVSTWHMHDPHPLLGALRQARLPSAVWIENPQTLPGSRYRDAPRLWFHDMAYGREAGAALAAHLRTLGHRRIAWIGPFHGSVWSRNRLEGLREGLGPGFALHEATRDWISEWDVQETVWNDPAIWDGLRLDGIDHRGKVTDLVRPIMESVARDRSLGALDATLAEALASGATLWVAASDLVAGWCLHWLSARGIAVPRDLALAGFDDSRDALRHDLTSVRFDAQSMARSMVRQILSPSRTARKTTRYHGAVVVRGSTGSAT